MSGDIQLEDPGELNQFAAKVRAVADYIASHQQSAASAVNLPPVRFGQDMDPTLTAVPGDLASKVQDSMSQIGGNVQTLIDKLHLIADTADDIAKRYSTAQELDHLSVTEVRSDLGVTPSG